MLKHIIALAVLLPSFLCAQHKIQGTFSPAEAYNMALLYKVTPTISSYVAHSEIKNGKLEIQLDSTITKGTYRIVYAIPQEDYNFDILYDAKEDVVFSYNTETGATFQESTENKLIASYTNSMSAITHSIGNFYRDESADSLALNEMFKIQKETQERYENEAKETIAEHFIKANKPYIPETFEDVETYTNNLKTYYFDSVDFNNEVLQSSSFLEERMINYVFGMSSNETDETANYKENIDVFYKVIDGVQLEIKKNLLASLWQEMANLGLEQIANYISDSYLFNIAKTLKDDEMVDGLTIFKNVSIGNKAPDFSFEIEENEKTNTKKLSELDVAENYIVVFWSSGCSHCLVEIPKLDEFIQTLEKDKVKVVAVGLEEEPYKWKDLTYEYSDFIHVYGEGKWDNEIGNNYGVTGTPTYFILNKDKEITARPENFETLKEYFAN